MAMKKTHDVVYAGEKYTDREGNEKTRYINVGAAFTRDDGSMTLKLESVPVNFTGWLNLYEPRAEGGERPQRGQRPQRQAPADSLDDGGDRIPF